MALTPATVTVTFTSNYAGVHRICYRYGSSGPYVCLTQTCTGGGATCSINLPIQVDNETCAPVNIQGYAQAACQDIASLIDRVPFNVTFTPSPGCLRYIFTCVSVGIATIPVTFGGTEYNVAPVVNILGGGGSGATATANLGTGAITNANLTNSGIGYTAPNGNYVVNLNGGSGTGAVASVTLAGGTIPAFTIVYPIGTGYTNGDVLVPATGVLGVPSTPANFTIVSNLGTVVSITISTVGAGYTTIHTITVAPGLGLTATATATLLKCGPIDTIDCTGTASIIPGNRLSVGQSISSCKQGALPVAPPGYQSITSASGNCPCTGVNITISATGTVGSLIGYTYNRVNGTFVSGTLAVGASPATINDCAVNGTVLLRNLGATPTLVVGAACP